MNFCPPAPSGVETLGGIVARRATIKSRRRDFAQSRFEFCPKDTANQKKRLLARPLRGLASQF